MDNGTERKVAPPVEPAPASGGPGLWVYVMLGIALVVALGCVTVVFLVLTGIIAEPETVIEQIVRALVGG
ncbi:MAG: hypothetical protein IBX63_04975 [Coriobacteriia bacterium]|nr:hypothetical protein [Coriobacteriia bacterium]